MINVSFKRVAKLGCFTSKSLIKKGKRDAQKNVITLNNHSNVPSSPFFDEEISLCLANIYKDFKKFLKYKKKLMKKCYAYNKQNNKFTTYIKEIESKKSHDKEQLDKLTGIKYDDLTISPDDLKPLLGEDIKIDDEVIFDKDKIREFRTIEKRAALELKKNKTQASIDNLTKNISKYPSRTLKYEKKIVKADALNDREVQKLSIRFDMFISICFQHYSITAARISSYWNGAMRELSKNNSVYEFDTGIILSELKQEIDKIKKTEMI